MIKPPLSTNCPASHAISATNKKNDSNDKLTMAYNNDDDVDDVTIIIIIIIIWYLSIKLLKVSSSAECEYNIEQNYNKCMERRSSERLGDYTQIGKVGTNSALLWSLIALLLKTF